MTEWEMDVKASLGLRVSPEAHLRPILRHFASHFRVSETIHLNDFNEFSAGIPPASWLGMSATQTTNQEDIMDLIAIRANDEQDGEIIIISAAMAEYDGVMGYRLMASNGDEIGHYRPQSIEQCRQDAAAQWGRWATFSWL
jgi:hypothetical protein